MQDQNETFTLLTASALTHVPTCRALDAEVEGAIVGGCLHVDSERGAVVNEGRNLAVGAVVATPPR